MAGWGGLFSLAHRGISKQVECDSLQVGILFVLLLVHSGTRILCKILWDRVSAGDKESSDVFCVRPNITHPLISACPLYHCRSNFSEVCSGHLGPLHQRLLPHNPSDVELDFAEAALNTIEDAAPGWCEFYVPAEGLLPCQWFFSIVPV